MGKGSNVQKKQAAQARNLEKKGKSEEERKAAREKSAKDASAFMCQICRQTFMSNAKAPLLYQHVVAKHNGTDPLACFPQQLQGFDPNDPEGLKKAAEAPATPTAAAKPKVVKKKDDPLDALLDAGLKKKK